MKPQVDSRIAALCGIAAAVVFICSSTWPASHALGAPQGALETTARAVHISAVVTDAQGEPLRDLTRDDFTVLDNEEPQRIMFFSPIDSERSVSQSRKAVPDTYTNVQPADSSVTILLFDTLNSGWTTQGYGLNRVRAFLRQIQPTDYVGVYVLGDSLKVVYALGSPAENLTRAVHRYDQQHSGSAVKATAAERESTGDSLLDGFLAGKDNRERFGLNGGACPPSISGYCADKIAFAEQMTAASLEAIARQLSTVAGRKSLIWVTDSIGVFGYFADNDLDGYLQRWRGQTGVTLPEVPSWERHGDVERMIRLMNSAGIAVYTVDARGLETQSLGFRERPNAVADVQTVIAETPQPNGAMIELANRTGGRAFYNRNDIETGIRRALNDSRFSYSMAYVPTHGKWAGEWRKIEVKVDRPGATVLARSGYFALPDPVRGSGKDRLELLSQVAATPINSAELPFTARLAVIRSATDSSVDATVHVTPLALSSILMPTANGRVGGHFEVVFMQLGEKDKLLDVIQKQIDADLTPEEYASLGTKGWDLPVRVQCKPGALLMCVIVHDERTDAVGSIRISVANESPPAQP